MLSYLMYSQGNTHYNLLICDWKVVAQKAMNELALSLSEHFRHASKYSSKEAGLSTKLPL